MIEAIQSEQRGTMPQMAARTAQQEKGVPLNPERIECFLETLRIRGRVEGTLEWYRRGLHHLYKMLPEDKEIRRGTLFDWKEHLVQEGYAARTINMFLVAADGFLEEAGARECQIAVRMRPEDEAQPELTRTEYLRLLQTARVLGRERVYLLVKLFATTGFPLQELPKVTVESVQKGTVSVESNGVVQLIRFPDFLQDELLAYIQRKGILSGPVFLTRSGAPMSRTNVSMGIRQLCVAAQVPEEKGNPRCLRKLYLSTRAEVEANVSLLVEQALQRQMEAEQQLVGWE